MTAATYAHAALGVIVASIGVCGIAGGWFWLRRLLHRREGRKPMATYTARWPVTRA